MGNTVNTLDLTGVQCIVSSVHLPDPYWYLVLRIGLSRNWWQAHREWPSERERVQRVACGVVLQTVTDEVSAGVLDMGKTRPFQGPRCWLSVCVAEGWRRSELDA